MAAVRQAEAGVDAARATMRLTEQATLQNGATAYMNVLRDTAVLPICARTMSRSSSSSCARRATASMSAR